MHFLNIHNTNENFNRKKYRETEIEKIFDFVFVCVSSEKKRKICTEK